MMLTKQATEVRKQWSETCDCVIHEKPVFVKRTRDKLWISSLDTLMDILSAYTFTADKYLEDDGSVTLSLNEIDLVENGADEQAAREKLGAAILEYSSDYYIEYELYSHAQNRKKHIPYILKALTIDNPEKIGKEILCRAGKN
ncbi:MAG: hypothetical protein LUC99_11455 [Clostridiales bacterium]|nr:hypothetical protein [Clostridiales bacterium]